MGMGWFWDSLAAFDVLSIVVMVLTMLQAIYRLRRGERVRRELDGNLAKARYLRRLPERERYDLPRKRT